MRFTTDTCLHLNIVVIEARSYFFIYKSCIYILVCLFVFWLFIYTYLFTKNKLSLGISSFTDFSHVESDCSRGEYLPLIKDFPPPWAVSYFT